MKTSNLSDARPGRSTPPFCLVWRLLAAALWGALCGGDGLAAEPDVVFGFKDYSLIVHERAGSAILEVLRYGPLGRSVSAKFHTENMAAVAGRDYVETRGTLVFGPEDTAQSIQISLLSHPGGEAGVNFRVVMENPSAGVALPWPVEAVVGIIDDDAVNAIRIGFASSTTWFDARETQGLVAIPVVRSGPTDAAVSVHFTTAGSTAQSGEDYEAQVGMFEFKPGETLHTITVPLVDDRNPEADETFRVVLVSTQPVVTIEIPASVTIQVQDDDTPVLLDPAYRPGLGLDDRVRALVRQPDGRLIVAGDFNFANGIRRDEVARFNADGSPDETFDAGPALRGRIGLGALALALQRDGKVLVGGDFTDTNDVRGPILVRLNADGSPDPTFTPATMRLFRVRAIAVQADDRILVGGQLATDAGLPLHLIRLERDGAPDPTFAVSVPDPVTGEDTVTFPNGEVLALAVQTDGRILFAGNFNAVGSVPRPHLAQVQADGSLDFTFDPGAGASKDVGAIALQPDGKILVAGEFMSFGGKPLWRIARLNEDGSLDPTFAPKPGANREIHALALQPDGRIVIGGEFNLVNETPRGYLARLNSDGSLDPGFNVGMGANDEVRALAVSDDAIYVGGDFTLFQGIKLNRLARLYPAATPTQTVSLMLGEYGVFESSGHAVLSVRRHGSVGVPLSVDYRTLPGTATTDEYTPTAGTITFDPTESVKTVSIPLRDDPVADDARQFAVELSNPSDGILGTYAVATVTVLDNEVPAVLDPAFGPPITAPQVNTLTLQPDGRLLLGGVFGVGEAPGPFATVVRLLADGSRDTSFVPPVLGAQARSVLLLPNGQMIVPEWFENGYRVARLESNGARDPTFNSPLCDDEVRILASAGEGRVLVGGDFTRLGGVERKRIARLDAAGALDAGFDPGSGANDQVLTIQEQPDHRVLIGGRFTKVGGTRRTYLARLIENGAVDPDFNAVLNDRVRCVVLLPDGRLLIGGRFTEAWGVRRLYLARLNANGSLDESFVPAAIDEEVRSLAVTGDGRIVVGGEFNTVGGFSRNRIARLNPDGSLDGLFQPGAGANNTVWTVLAQPDGQIVIGGEFLTVAGSSRPGIARLNGEQPPGLEVVPLRPGAPFTVRLHGVPPNTYRLEVSSDFVDWQPVGTLQLTGPTLEWPDWASLRHAHRFYRAWRVRN